ncbi:MAG TPA: selenocysteine-specific translation elongation factor [Planctomycetota bacterium]|nr:selenocysteine-specific translation elongation factor [Planctomycetota bacterium]
MATPLKTTDIYNVIVGTAGHIDHGKSTLVKRLTGIDPDRLPEEKEREMTIDLGFAPFTLKDGKKVGIIDVPGHERFIKNMVAGATSIDIVLLIVASDESINIQTREHVSIMTLLGLKRGIIVLTKSDKADADMRALVADDVKTLVRGTFLETAPILPVSALTGDGIDALVDTINTMVAETPPHDVSGVFRMPIQRIFSAKGFGTVITGVPMSGKAKIADTLEIIPLGKTGRIRSLQAYKADVAEVRAGHSSAINITDVAHEEVRRGMVAATPGYFKASMYVEARFRYVPDKPRTLKNFSPIKLHAGTAECDGHIVLLDKKELNPGEEGYVQFRLDEPIVVVAGDPYIARLQTPMYTIGGGRILDASDQKLKRLKDEITMKLVEKEQTLSSETSSLEFALKDAGRKTLNLQELSIAAKMPLKGCEEGLKAIESKLVRFEPNRFMHPAAFEGTMDHVAVIVENYHIKNPLRAGMEYLALKNEAKLEVPLFERALKTLVERGTLVHESDKVRRATFKVKISKDDAECSAEVERAVRETRFNTPRVDELHARFPKYTKERVDRALGFLVDGGAVIRLKDDVLFHRDSVKEAAEIIGKAIREKGPIEAAQFRDLVGTTRKYVIPLLEHLDDIGVTQRVENKRVLRKK